MTKEAKLKMKACVIDRTSAGCCPFCNSKKEEGHLPFCIFEDFQSLNFSRGKTIESDTLHKWIEGFSDGFNSFQKQKSPYYLMGNKAGREMKS